MLSAILVLVSVALAIVTSVLGVLWSKSRTRLLRFASIANIEGYAQSVKAESELTANQLQATKSELAKQKQAFQTYVQVVGIVRSAAEAQQKLDKLKLELAEYSKSVGVMRSLADAQQKLERLKREASAYSDLLGPLQSAGEVAAKLKQLQAAYNKAKADLEQVEEAGQGKFSRTASTRRSSHLGRHSVTCRSSNETLHRRKQWSKPVRLVRALPSGRSREAGRRARRWPTSRSS